jgi:major membrane immunogen (membrane-anchored lipoprotein)
MKKIVYTFLALSLLLTSCSSKVPFTTIEQTKYKLSNDDVRSLQFYTMGDIVMTNSQGDKSNKTEDGELVIKDNVNSNKIIIAANTRGVVEKVEGDIMYVSFEEGKNLKFKASPTDGRYRIKSDSFDARKRMGVVNYGNEKFFVNSTSLKAYLVFKLKNSTKRKSNARSVKGRKL